MATTEQLERLQVAMRDATRIRNISVIAHVDHGKSTLSDSLVAKAGLISEEQAGNVLHMSVMREEQERGITIKSSGLSLVHRMRNGNDHVINLIDSPGHVDFSSEVTAALRVTDGALVVVDAIDGVCGQTETVLRQACAERIRSVLIINKLDRAITEKQLTGEEIYRTCVETIDRVNVVLATYLPECMTAQHQNSGLLDPTLGTVAFASGKECWGFRIQDFARFYAAKYKWDEEKLTQRLWGDHFYDAAAKRWRCDSVGENGKQLKRGFVEFVIEPIIQLFKVLAAQENVRAIKLATQLGVQLREGKCYGKERNQTAAELSERELRKLIFSNWLPVADNVLQMVAEQLPSPCESMRYRTELLYDGPLDDPVATAMRECDPKGPLVVYISKMVPNKDYSKFYAFGRVFAGTLTAGQKVFVLGAQYDARTRNDLFEKSLSCPLLLMARKVENVSVVPCGNTVALSGFDSLIQKTATITDYKDSYPIRAMKFSVSPVVQVAVAPKKASDLPSLVKGLKKLAQSDPLVQCTVNENTGEHLVAGSGELHVEVCLKLLAEEFAGCELVLSQPIVQYQETVAASAAAIQNAQPLFVKSANKHVKLWGNAYALNGALVEVLQNEGESFVKSLEQNSTETRERLVSEFDWERDDTKRIWVFGPELGGAAAPPTNVLVDQCKQVQGLAAIRDSITTSFGEVVQRGALAGERLRGVRFNLLDASVHSDAAHRGAGQVIPMARRLFQGAQLAADPRLEEPIYLTEIQVPQDVKNSIYALIARRRGQVIDEQLLYNTPLCVLKAYIPVAESFGFTDKLRQAANGQAFHQCVFDHWQTLSGSPLEQGTAANTVVKTLRARYALKADLPTAADFLDKE